MCLSVSTNGEEVDWSDKQEVLMLDIVAVISSAVLGVKNPGLILVDHL